MIKLKFVQFWKSVCFHNLNHLQFSEYKIHFAGFDLSLILPDHLCTLTSYVTGVSVLVVNCSFNVTLKLMAVQSVADRNDRGEDFPETGT